MSKPVSCASCLISKHSNIGMRQSIRTTNERFLPCPVSAALAATSTALSLTSSASETRQSCDSHHSHQPYLSFELLASLLLARRAVRQTMFDQWQVLPAAASFTSDTTSAAFSWTAPATSTAVSFTSSAKSAERQNDHSPRTPHRTFHLHVMLDFYGRDRRKHDGINGQCDLPAAVSCTAAATSPTFSLVSSTFSATAA